jgi:hypothetical protein
MIWSGLSDVLDTGQDSSVVRRCRLVYVRYVYLYCTYITLPARWSCNGIKGGDEDEHQYQRTHLSAQSRALLGAMRAGEDGREP